jgi:7,8-dihydroneopterin aldolase/epimerase/oxygenase
VGKDTFFDFGFRNFDFGFILILDFKYLNANSGTQIKKSEIPHPKSEIQNLLLGMITIAIQGAEFFAYHGFYPEEQKLGTKFIVDIEVNFVPAGNIKEDKIGNTVDYEKVYQILVEQMKHTRKLIETVAQSIADDIKRKYPFIDSIKVTMKKVNPPLSGRVDHTSIIITA